MCLCWPVLRSICSCRVNKQKAYDRLHSINQDYDDIFPYEEGATVIGRVLGKIEKDMIPSMEEQSLYLEALETLNL